MAAVNMLVMGFTKLVDVATELASCCRWVLAALLHMFLEPDIITEAVFAMNASHMLREVSSTSEECNTCRQVLREVAGRVPEFAVVASLLHGICLTISVTQRNDSGLLGRCR
jgi:hypothetical protein